MKSAVNAEGVLECVNEKMESKGTISSTGSFSSLMDGALRIYNSRPK